jgi:hypothetical protein
MEDKIIEKEIRESGAGQEEPKFETSGVRPTLENDDQALDSDQAETQPAKNRPDGAGASEPEEPGER